MKLSNASKPDVSSFNLRTRVHHPWIALSNEHRKPRGPKVTRSACESSRNLSLDPRPGRWRSTIFFWEMVVFSSNRACCYEETRPSFSGGSVSAREGVGRWESLEGDFSRRFRISAGLIVERALEGFSNAAISLPPPSYSPPIIVRFWKAESRHSAPLIPRRRTQSHRFRASQAGRLCFRHRRLSCRDNMLISQPVMLINGRGRDVDLAPLPFESRMNLGWRTGSTRREEPCFHVYYWYIRTRSRLITIEFANDVRKAGVQSLEISNSISRLR